MRQYELPWLGHSREWKILVSEEYHMNINAKEADTEDVQTWHGESSFNAFMANNIASIITF
jgi:hypothetical protein